MPRIYYATIDALDKLLGIEKKRFDQLNENADNEVRGTIAEGLVSDDLFTTIAAYGQLTDEQDKTNGRIAVGVTAFNQMGEAIGELNQGFGAAVGGMALLIQQVAAFKDTVQDLKSVLPEDGIFGISQDTVAKAIAGLQIVGTALGAYGSALQGLSQQRVQQVERDIELEKRIDGKSAQSVAKIKAMEDKKLAIQKKAFEQNKKIQIAQAIINTAAGAAAALAIPVVGPALAAMITALGMAQINLIKKTTFQGGESDVPAPRTALTIGDRSSAVDVAKQTSAGELNYLRGGQTTGNDLGGAGASLPGGAMGRRGYANGGEGIMVGERGPEVITPAAPVDITPNYALGATPTNVNFSITTLDASGVEDVLTNQRGNIIRMIREAANENGELFLENVDPLVYGGGD